ncbi:LysR family transcriptional regulator [Methylobacterium sp. Leaf89]|uniref:LysR family transcriptional regulator n=1 Tax=Methylobacterium sp. Leaf89 TaxID=1736245 RepID=UPI0006FBB0B7|nr:LysR family transcriptional regulator [Methylobacterium sp. Leaf89]KQO67744.1 LysR family transcriptional regulator [Methylobacterium sp. Leaf89]
MDEPDWHLWRAFLGVMRAGSLSGAARDLRLTQPTLGRQIAALERSLGATLFTRARDGLRPTDRALDLVPQAEAMAAAAAALLRRASGETGAMRGRVRLTASTFLGGVVLPPMLARFHAAHPGVDLELSLSDRTEDLLRRDADLAVRNVAPTQGALVARRIGTAPIRFYAHRTYAARRGLPATAAELGRHSLIGRAVHAARVRPTLGHDLTFAFACDDDLGLLAALRAGFGIGYCQEGVARRDPDLVPVLPGLVLAEIGIWLVMHEDLRTTRRIRALFDHLALGLTGYLGEELPA